MPQATATKTHKPTRVGSSLLNRTRVKQYVLFSVERHHRHGVITRMSDEAFSALESVVMRTIDNMVQHHPSGMRTLKPF